MLAPKSANSLLPPLTRQLWTILVAYLWLIVCGPVGILFSRTIHRYNRFLGVPQHIPTGRHSVVALRALGAAFLLAGILGLRYGS